MVPTVLIIKFKLGIDEPRLNEYVENLYLPHVPAIGAQVSIPYCGADVVLEVLGHRYHMPKDPKSKQIDLTVVLGLPSGVPINVWYERLAELRKGAP